MSDEPSTNRDKPDQAPTSDSSGAAAQGAAHSDIRSQRGSRRERREQQRAALAESNAATASKPTSSTATQDRLTGDSRRVDSIISGEPGTKRERRIAAREDRKRRAANAQKMARIRLLIVAVVAVVVIAAIIGILVTSGVFTGLMTSSVGVPVPTEAADHVPEGSQITWKSRPPSSGPHYPVWSQNYGVLEQGLAPGYWVHNLEHGAIVILYNCPDGCPDVVQQLKDLYPTLPKGRNAVRGLPRVIIVPYTDMDTKIAAVAWGWLLQLDHVDADKITQFVEQRIDRGPECVNFACP